MSTRRIAHWIVCIAPLAAAATLPLVGCGSDGPGSTYSDPATTHNDGDGGGSPPDLGSDGGFTNPQGANLVSLSIDPPTATIESLNGAQVTQRLKAIAHWSDNTTSELANVTWSASEPQVGSIASGLYTASGLVGGVVNVSAQSKDQKTANATLTVKLHVQKDPGSIAANVQAALKGATTADGAVTWAYPYDGTVWPRGLDAPTLMWNGSAAADVYYVHLTSPTFELEQFTTAAPPARVDIDGSSWSGFVNSTVGAANLSVSRWNGTAATVIASHKWTVAAASMLGSVYYWANKQGRVMRLKPQGAAKPEDFSAPNFPGVVGGCTMTCHTVSADGSTLISGGDGFGGTYDLVGNKLGYNRGGRPWAMPALTPNGKYLVENSSPLPGPPGAETGLWDTATGKLVPSSGLETAHLGMPAFSPDGSLLAYVNVQTGALAAYDFELAVPAATNSVDLVQQGTGALITFPTVTPDAKWIIYSRGVLDTRSGHGDLYFASAVTPNQEVRLSAVDGDTYPFAAGDRDKSFNYEPTFAPVASGGYFWVVFTSRRTYGNLLTGGSGEVKQLWVAAIDQNPAPGKDPSHPAFRLPGQDETLNMRGYWALDPCKGDGAGCGSGTECCGGFCSASADGGGAVCGKTTTKGCSDTGDRCSTSADCCDSTSGVVCINSTCSSPPPR